MDLDQRGSSFRSINSSPPDEYESCGTRTLTSPILQQHIVKTTIATVVNNTNICTPDVSIESSPKKKKKHRMVLTSSQTQESDIYKDVDDDLDAIIPESPHPNKIWHVYEFNTENINQKHQCREDDKENLTQFSSIEPHSSGCTATSITNTTSAWSSQDSGMHAFSHTPSSTSTSNFNSTPDSSGRNIASKKKHLGGPIPIDSHVRFRVGLSKKVRVDSLHRHLAKKDKPSNYTKSKNMKRPLKSGQIKSG